MTRYLIVNADDFGRSPRINRGIIDAHEGGIVTSASLMVRFPAAAAAAEYAVTHRRLSVGLHLDLGERVYRQDQWVWAYHLIDLEDRRAVQTEITRQLGRFHRLLQRWPTHFDSHQHVHLEEPVRSVALDAAERLGIPLRDCTPRIQYCGKFYGQTRRGEPYHEGLKVTALLGILQGLGPGTHELSCHPGYPGDVESDYGPERELEIGVLCDPAVATALTAKGFELRSFHHCA